LETARSDEHRVWLQDQLEELDRLVTGFHMSRIRQVRVVSAEKIRALVDAVTGEVGVIRQVSCSVAPAKAPRVLALPEATIHAASASGSDPTRSRGRQGLGAGSKRARAEKRSSGQRR